VAPFIAEESLSRIRNAANIVDVISDYVALKQAGKNYVGLCPFHAEKTPSFSVNQDKQIYHCFGCGAGGDVFGFLMRNNNMSFIEAVVYVARRYGMDLPDRSMPEAERKRAREKETLYAVNAAAKEYFRSGLARGGGSDGPVAYLASRGLPRAVIDAFELGYAPRGWRHLAGYLGARGVAPEDAVRAGLLAPGESGGFYDRFRERIVFPIMSVGGQVVGFGGRVLDDPPPKYLNTTERPVYDKGGTHTPPKYLNTPETPVYNKRRILYGLQITKEHCRRHDLAFIVEGYFDLLSLYAAGVRNCAATCGTALTPEHIRLLKGYAKKMVLVYDSDEAGLRAAERSLAAFSAEQVSARVLVLPSGHDPDSFVRSQGAAAFGELADKAMDLVPFVMESAIRRHGLSIEGKARIVASLTEPIASVSDAIARSLYVKHLAERLAVDEGAVLEEVRRARQRKSKDRTVGSERASTAHGSVTVRPATSFRMEEKIVAMMLHCPGIVPEIREGELLRHFQDTDLQEIGSALVALHEQGTVTVGPDLMSHVRSEQGRKIVASLWFAEEAYDLEGCRKTLAQFVRSLGKRESRDLQRRIKKAEETCDQELLNRLLAEKQRLAGTHTPR